MDAFTSRIRFVLFLVGLGLLGMAAVSGAMNFKAGTLFDPQHGIAVLSVTLVGIGILYLSHHFQLPSGLALPHGAGAALSAVERAAAPLIQRLEDKAKELASTEGAKLKDAIVQTVRDESGKFGITLSASQNLESIYHLATQAAAVADPILKDSALALLRDLNDQFFLLHHDIKPTTPEVQNDPKPAAKNPAVPA